MVRVRFAPSPSGSLHIGSARTAIVNYLFAKSQQGKFILRIEDTDSLRSSQESKVKIVNTLKWLGIQWDEGPFYQSERGEQYSIFLNQMLSSGKAYRCFCTPDELLSEQSTNQTVSDYDGRCSRMTPEDIQKRMDQKKPYIIRLKMPMGVISFQDVNKGKISIQGETISDFVIARSDGTPTYNFAVVIDDHLMSITHVIRGEDHLPNTPKQLVIYKALGWDPPLFCHLPLILGPDKTKLSKRHCDTAIEDYQEQGFLPETLFCYLALLGYSHQPSKEIFEQKQLIDDFILGSLVKSPSQFDIKNLIWMNSQFIKKKNGEELWEQSQKWIQSIQYDEEKKKQIFMLTVNQVKILSDFQSIIKPFYEYNLDLEAQPVRNLLLKEPIFNFLNDFFSEITSLDINKKSDFERVFENILDRKSYNKQDSMQILRLVAVGKLVSPPLFDTLHLIGKDELINRYSIFLSEIKHDKKN